MNLHEAGDSSAEDSAEGKYVHWDRLGESRRQGCPTEDHPSKKAGQSEGSRGPLHIEDSRVSSYEQDVDAADAESTDEEDYGETYVLRVIQAVRNHQDGANSSNHVACKQSSLGTQLLEDKTRHEVGHELAGAGHYAREVHLLEQVGEVRQ